MEICISTTIRVNVYQVVDVNSIDDVRLAVERFEEDMYRDGRFELDNGNVIEYEAIEAEHEPYIDDDGTGYFSDTMYDFIYKIIHDPDHELHGTDDSEADDDDDDSDDDDDDLVEKPVDAVDAPTPEAVNDVDSDNESPIANASEAAPTAPTMVVSKPKFASRRNHRSFTAKVKSVFNRIARRF